MVTPEGRQYNVGVPHYLHIWNASKDTVSIRWVIGEETWLPVNYDVDLDPTGSYWFYYMVQPASEVILLTVPTEVDFRWNPPACYQNLYFGSFEGLCHFTKIILPVYYEFYPVVVPHGGKAFKPEVMYNFLLLSRLVEKIYKIKIVTKIGGLDL